MTTSQQAIGRQWANPGDILSILLLIGSDIVQKAIAQLAGYQLRLPGTRTHVSIAPVAFSFGWATYAFSNLVAAVGSMRLMPASDYPSILVNCSNGFIRDNRSWVLGRVLRDHEIHNTVDSRPLSEGGRAESIRIDIFHMKPVGAPQCDLVWWLGWVTVLTQLAIVTVPGILYGDWAILLIALAGIILVAITCALPQWVEEKWVKPNVLRRDKVTCLTRGNGHAHIMVFIGYAGSWDLEVLATRTPVPHTGTRWISLILAILWVCLLISISGLEQHTWFLIGIGGLGMLQNVLAAGISRSPAASNFHLTRFERAPTIIGRQQGYIDDPDADVDLSQDVQELSDLDAWVSDTRRSQSQEGDGPCSHETVPMPPWMDSMAKEDGVPGWLRTCKPTNDKETTHKESGCVRHNSLASSFASKHAKPAELIYTTGVHGALVELEKWVPNAGLSMVQVFFPGGLQYRDEAIRDNVHKKFWKRAYLTRTIREKAEEKRRTGGNEAQEQLLA